MSRFHLGNRAWAKVRKQVLDEENWKCSVCKKWGNEVDHIKPIFRGGAEYERDNLQAICRGCHIDKSRRERGSKPPIPGSKDWDLLLQQLVI